MKSYLSFAWKELKSQRIASILILIAVIMSTMMTTVIGQSMGILQSMRLTQAEELNGSRYAIFHQLTAEQAKELHKDSRLYDVGDILNVGNTKLGNSSLTLYLREYQGNTLAMYPPVGKVKEGCLPKKENEIALPEDALTYLGLNASVGDTVSLNLSAVVMDGSVPAYDYSADFTLTAVLESSYLGYATGIVDGIAGKGTAKKLLPEEYLRYSTDFKTHSKADFQEIIDDLAATLNLEDFYIQYNGILLDVLDISYDGEESTEIGIGFPFMAFACILVGILVLFAAGLVIYNILKISVTKRIKEYGALRAIGGERGQIYRLVSLQLLILCGVGIPLGLLAGILSAKGVLIAATGILNPELFMVNSTEELKRAINSADTGGWLYLLISVVITLIFAVIAAFPAARYASHVSPTVAMFGQAVKIKRRVRKNKKLHRFEAYYARLNLKRGRGRTVITILSLVMSITVFVALQCFTDLLDASDSISDMHTGDYAVTNETTGISEEAVNAVRENELVESLKTTKLSVYMHINENTFDNNMLIQSLDKAPFDTDLTVQSHETLQIVSLDEARLLSCVFGLTEQDKADLFNDTACLIKNPIALSIGGTEIQYTNINPDDIITFNGNPMRVAGIANAPVTINNAGFSNGVQVIVTDNIYNFITGSNHYSEIYPTLKEDTNAEAFENWIDDWCAANPGTHWLSYRMSDEQAAESFEQIGMLCWVLIIFIGIIGVLNIVNTVYSNIHTRVSEIGIQRAIGMSIRSLYKTFLWEGAYYGIYASIIGAVLGYVCTIFIAAAEINSLQLVRVPILTIGEAAIVSIIACLLATAIPLRQAVKMSIVVAIETVE